MTFIRLLENVFLYVFKMQLQSLKSDDTSQFMSLQPRLQGDGGGGPALGRGRPQGRWLGLCWHHLALTIVEL